tara:strand:- start:164 stop:343 length:180 start_codon:yes stop_codon:yes gene_type:complete
MVEKDLIMFDALEETVYGKGMSLEIKIYLYHGKWCKSNHERVYCCSTKPQIHWFREVFT